MAERNFLAVPPHGMSSALLRAAPIAAMMEWGGNRITFDLPLYLQQLAGPAAARRQDPVYICLAAAMTVRDDGIDRSARHVKVVVQACACGYPVDLVSRNLQAVLIVMRDQLRRIPDQMEPTRLEWLRNGRPAVGEDAALPAVPWMALQPTDAQLAEAVHLRDIHNALMALYHNGEDHRPMTIRILAHGLMAYCKQGSCTTNVINRVSNGIRDSMGFTVVLDSNTIRDVWNIVGSWMSPEKAAMFFRIWEEAIGPGCLRLQLLVNQASWAGMTNYRNILSARDKFGDFPWAGLATIIPEEFRAFQEARRVVNNNPYYGYNRDLGAAKATLYPNLAYTAYQLLREIDGDRDLSDFQGVNRRVSQAPYIDTMINAYRAARTQNLQERIAAPGAGAVRLATAFGADAVAGPPPPPVIPPPVAGNPGPAHDDDLDDDHVGGGDGFE